MMKRWLIISIYSAVVLGTATTVFAVGSGSGSTPKPTNSTNSVNPIHELDQPTNTNTTNTSTTANTSTANSVNPTTTTATDTPAIISTCEQDSWSCNNWSDSCDNYGNEERRCTLVTDCANDTTTPDPDRYQPCSKLQCGNEPELRDRIYCRLNLTPAAMSRELEIQYLPEECRAITDTDQQAGCIVRYQNYKPCWNFTSTTERVQCARDILKLSPVLADDIKQCADQACLIKLRDQAYQLIKFRLYELEERAEELAEQGANLGAVADFVAVIVNKKIEFNTATTTEQRRQAILDVRTSWQNFITNVTPDLQ